jgi:hypothetical protein
MKRFRSDSRHVAGCTLTFEIADRRVKLANEVTFKRMKDAMETLRDTSAIELSSLANILLGHSAPSVPVTLADVKFIDETLNDSQKEAVRFCLSAPELALIHGPPGVPHYPKYTNARPEKHIL